MIYGKTLSQVQFSQERRPIRSVSSDALTNIYNGGLTKCDTKTAQICKKNSFTIENDIEAEGLSSPKSIGILTLLRCISSPNLVILAWMGEKVSSGRAQNGMNLD